MISLLGISKVAKMAGNIIRPKTIPARIILKDLFDNLIFSSSDVQSHFGGVSFFVILKESIWTTEESFEFDLRTDSSPFDSE